MENQKQIKKDLRSNKSIKDPVILMSYDDTYDKDDKDHGPFYKLSAWLLSLFLLNKKKYICKINI